MRFRRFGDLVISAVGLGGLGLSKEGRPDRTTAIRTIHAAIDSGVNLIDTAPAYHAPGEPAGHNEELIAEALARWSGDRSALVISTKGGLLRTPDGEWLLNGTPEHLWDACRSSLQRLQVDAIDIYHYHRVDPRVPFEDSVGTLRDMLDAGLIRRAGISNVDTAQILAAREILGDGLASVQNQFGPTFRSTTDTKELCADLGIAFLAWRAFGGLVGSDEPSRARAAFLEVAVEHTTSVFAVAVAWILAGSQVAVPLMGATDPAMLRGIADAVELTLTEGQMARLDGSS